MSFIAFLVGVAVGYYFRNFVTEVVATLKEFLR